MIFEWGICFAEFCTSMVSYHGRNLGFICSFHGQYDFYGITAAFQYVSMALRMLITGKYTITLINRDLFGTKTKYVLLGQSNTFCDDL